MGQWLTRKILLDQRTMNIVQNALNRVNAAKAKLQPGNRCSQCFDGQE